MPVQPAVFLDRDGVIVIPEFREGRSFAPTRLENFHIYSSAAPSLNALREAGFLTVVVTNQPDVGRGIISEKVISAMHNKLSSELAINRIEMCTHISQDNCDCRKPQWGMLRNAASELDILLDQSFMIGDRKSDVDAGNSAGCKTIFIDHNYTAEQKPLDADWTTQSIEQAVACILEFKSKHEGQINDTR